MIGDNLRSCFAPWSSARCDDNLAFLGELDLPLGAVPCYLARGLGDRRIFERLDVLLRGENRGRRGVVFDAGDSGLSFLAAHVVVPIGKYLDVEGDRALHLDAISVTFDRLRRLASANGSVELICHSEKAATLIVPGRDSLPLIGAVQITIFRRLVHAHRRGAPGVPTSELLEGSKARSPQNAFTPERWAQINGVYIAKVGKRSGWRLVVETA
jgi:hypothetical protein